MDSFSIKETAALLARHAPWAVVGAFVALQPLWWALDMYMRPLCESDWALISDGRVLNVVCASGKSVVSVQPQNLIALEGAIVVFASMVGIAFGIAVRELRSQERAGVQLTS